MEKSKTVKILKKYFEKESAVLLAFVFGSFAKGLETKESDFDIGVYFKNYKPGVTQKEENKIWFEVTRLVKKSVDLISLNEAPATLISSIFKTGIPLTIKDKKLYWELYLQANSEAEDFLYFLEDFRKIKEKAKSLKKEEKERLLIRIDYLKDELKELDRFRVLSWKEYLENRDKRKLIERWTENILNAVIDIAKIILASEKKEMPRSYEEALFNFALFVNLNVNEAKKFSKLANLRNILAHQYLNILYKRIQNFIKEFPPLYKKISKFLDQYLKEKSVKMK